MPNDNNIPVISPERYTSPVNIYKNINKWATPNTSGSKCGQKSFANDRLKRLKQHLVTTDTNTSSFSQASEESPTNIKEMPTTNKTCELNLSAVSRFSFNNEVTSSSVQDVHNSPLLRGTKRIATGEAECSSAKRIAVEIPQSRTERLLHNALSQNTTNYENVATVNQGNVKRSISDRLKLKNNSSNEPEPTNKQLINQTSSSNSDSLSKFSKSVSNRLKLKQNSDMSIQSNPSSTKNQIAIKAINNTQENDQNQIRRIRLKYPTKRVSIDTPNSINKESNVSANNSEDKPTAPVSKPQSLKRPRSFSVDTDSEHSEKMKMTATWVVSHYLIPNSHYDPYSKVDQTVKPENIPINSSIPKEEVKQPQIPDEMEEMEWANAEPDEGTEPSKEPFAELESIRESIKEDEPTSTCFDESEKKFKIEENEVKDVIKKDPEKEKALCIVVDTNIFLHNLSKLKDILEMKIIGPLKPILYIPWMVITELDYMKDSSCSNEKLKKDVLNAIKFINVTLEKKHERVSAQTVYEVQNQKQLGTSADDKIMACCIQVQEKYESVILLSNDLNLKNKAMINAIEACSSNEIIMKIMSKLTKNVKYQKVHHRMSMLCSSIICDAAKATYGDTWIKMKLFSCPPWSLLECLKRFKKCWVSLFSDKLLKHFTQTLDETLVWLKNNKYFADDSEEYVKFVKLCITLCIHLRDIEESRGAVQKTLQEITKIG